MRILYCEEYIDGHKLGTDKATRCLAPPRQLDVSALEEAASREASNSYAGWLIDHQIQGIFLDAAMNGHLDVVEFLHNETQHIASAAAKDEVANHSHLDVVQFLHQYRLEGCTTKAMKEAARSQRLRRRRSASCESCTTTAQNDVESWVVDCAAQNVHLEVVKFLRKQHVARCTQHAMDSAAQKGHVDVCDFSHRHCCERCATAAWNENLEMVGFLHEFQATSCVPALGLALRNKHMEVARWLHEHKLCSNCGTDVMDTVISLGRLVIGCTTKAMDEAAGNGHLDVVTICMSIGLKVAQLMQCITQRREGTLTSCLRIGLKRAELTP
ncbi:TPA: LOW QUALITY PROTEIN: hypothetical protein N0F65_004089 [Lagenidium giganteum]|uniref:Ankyrin repeat-containing domain n=1 Tax=Lagenidium giganteum TaxID=4803 RepID=A0AAV2Z1V5_9STRA|nr:TPA: LOW QUALITY PROTEIN: hypothetical protein N0F65_004089 [Lagenidium giganteum]